MLTHLSLGQEHFIWRAVPTFIARFINVALILQCLEPLLHRLHMGCISGADETVVFDLIGFPGIDVGIDETINERLWILTRLLSCLRNLLAMLIGAR